MERLKGNDLMSVGPYFVEPLTSTGINNILSTFHTNEGYAQPNRYEVLIFPPDVPASGNQNPSKKLLSESISLSDKKKSPCGVNLLLCQDVTYLQRVIQIFMAR